MFGKLKNKLKGFFSKAEKEAEDAAEAEEELEEEKEETKNKKEKKKPKKKSGKKQEKTKKEETKKEIEPPASFSVGRQKVEPDLEKLEQKAEQIKKQERTEKQARKEKEEKKKTEKKAKEREEKKAKEEEKEEKKGFFSKFKKKFEINEEYFGKIFEELEFILLENNVAFEVVEKIKSDLKNQLIGIEIKKDEVENKIKQALKNSIENLFVEKIDLIKKIKQKDDPFVILFFGINGSGKTTTIAKLAHKLKKNKLSVVLAASDTFRAASIEQLEKHGEKLDVKVIKGEYGADPASIAFDAIKHAQSHKLDAVLVDTAGRMYTKQDLMREMGKISRVSEPDLKIFVAESITGNDAVEQAKKFNEAVGIDAIILTKADVDARGGSIISVSHITGKPIIYLGSGQNYEDLEEFDKEKIIKQLELD